MGRELKPDTPPRMHWTLVDEIGIERATKANDARAYRSGVDLPLQFPSYAEKFADGSYLISDELGTEKLVPFRFESRTLCVNPEGETRFDSKAQGIDDGFGCLLDDGSIAILRRTTWELLIVSAEGQTIDCLPLWFYSKRMPRSVSFTRQGTFLLVFCNRVREVELIEIDRQGRLLWTLQRNAGEIGLAGSIQWLASDTFLIADPFRHVVVQIDREGNVVWSFGQAGRPSQDQSHLSSPTSARILPDDRVLVADTRNHRILLVDRNGSSRPLQVVDDQLCDPLYADVLDDGNILVCDTGNQRVVELTPDGHVVWSSQKTPAPTHLFSYPRSVEITESETYLIADTAYDRILEVEPKTKRMRQCSVEVQPPLFWPRCVRSLPGGGMLIADGRNGRILEISPSGHAVHELREIELDGRTPLRDPHDVRMLPDGRLLIVDSSRDLVVETDWMGRVYRSVGESTEPLLRDPHSARQMPDGRLVIADTGNHRILILDADGKRHRCIDRLQSERSMLRLNYPRYVEIVDDEILIIADTGNNRILAVTPDSHVVWEFVDVPGTCIDRLNQPRWVCPISQDELVVCDHYHHRILHVSRTCQRDA